MKTTITVLILLVSLNSFSQSTISGYVRDKNLDPIPGANVYFEGSYDGASSDTSGQFTFKTKLKGNQKLLVSFIGYDLYQKELILDEGNQELEVILEESYNEIDAVVITAGTFEASDKKISSILSPIDIASTPSAQGDIYGALAAMPGSQKVGEEGMLFVRGGESYETKTFMDGILIQTPYFSKLPDIPTRGRFSPLLFSETVFSTGGYSAEYGQALSSIVSLNTLGLEEKDKTSISLMTVGASASTVKRWDNTSLALSGMLVNNALSNVIFKPNIDWITAPTIGEVNMMFRHKVRESGLIKSFIACNYSSSNLMYDNFEENKLQHINMKDNNIFFNTTYSDMLSEKWMIKAGLGYNFDVENADIDYDNLNTNNTSGVFKVTFTNFISDQVKLKFGSDIIHHNYKQEIRMNDFASLAFINNQISAFAEAEINLTKKIAFRVGARTEYSSLLNATHLTPRLSAAYKTGKYSQISFAYGMFEQNPEDDYLKMSRTLSTERSTHYILNYQYKKNNRVFRVEAYHKNYSSLVKFSSPYSIEPENYNNLGYGSSQGLDLFWRDKQTFRNTDYWISYSYNHSDRDYQDYPICAIPSYSSAHNLSLVYKRFFNRLNTFFGVTYSFASGRPYNNPNSNGFMTGKTKTYNDISLNATYLTRVFNKEAIIHLNFTNVLGFENVYGYRFRNIPDDAGMYEMQAVIPPSKRMAVLLISILF
ncbi:MAG: TonB-dependent receptor [Bacteroidales bacterium]|nr:TonB-dependent receptor [Bacteroidales bacterium]